MTKPRNRKVVAIAGGVAALAVAGGFSAKFSCGSEPAPVRETDAETVRTVFEAAKHGEVCLSA